MAVTKYFVVEEGNATGLEIESAESDSVGIQEYEIPPLACLRILLARVESILAGGKLADHGLAGILDAKYVLTDQMCPDQMRRPDRADHWVRASRAP